MSDAAREMMDQLMGVGRDFTEEEVGTVFVSPSTLLPSLPCHVVPVYMAGARS